VQHCVPAIVFLGDVGRPRGFLEAVEIFADRLALHREVSREDGGREGESNPLRTVSRPFPDFKAGRPTRDGSLPGSAFGLPGAASAGRRNRSSRCLLIRLRSPRRKVTPWRSKNSRIWIATFRPLSRRSRSCAAENCPSSPEAPRSLDTS